MSLNWHSRACIQLRLVIYFLVALAATILSWKNLISSWWLFPIYAGWWFLTWSERCPNCGSSYMLQWKKSIFSLGKVCGKCGAPIGSGSERSES